VKGSAVAQIGALTQMPLHLRMIGQGRSDRPPETRPDVLMAHRAFTAWRLLPHRVVGSDAQRTDCLLHCGVASVCFSWFIFANARRIRDGGCTRYG